MNELGQNPAWMSFGVNAVRASLVQLNAPVLWTSYSAVVGGQSPGRKAPIEFYADFLSTRFVEECRMVGGLPVELLKLSCADHAKCKLEDLAAMDRFETMGMYFRQRFGVEAFRGMVKPGIFIYRSLISTPVSTVGLPEPFCYEELDIMWVIDSQEVGYLRDIIRSVHYERGLNKNARSVSCAKIVARYLCTRLREVWCGSDEENISFLSCLNPFHRRCTLSGLELARYVLEAEFGAGITSRLSGCRRAGLAVFSEASEEESDPSTWWPKPLDDKVVYNCLRDYHKNSQWVAPDPCAVCGRTKFGSVVKKWGPEAFSNLAAGLVDFASTSLPSEFSVLFEFDNSWLKGKLLDARAIVSQSSDVVVLVCDECSSAFSRGVLPKFALANGLFRGELPREFQDLTWIEEMVCCLYKPSAFVTRLYGSQDASSPRVMSGNTCAHFMNVTSTVNVLPRTVEDVRSLLSVVFIGTCSLDKAYLRDIFHVRKRKVWRFLLWLKRYNVLYSRIRLDESILAQYPEGDCLPGMEDRVVSVDLPAGALFDEETAGISEHPAQNVPSVSGVGRVFLERFGMADTEGSTLLGRDLHAAAVRNVTRKLKGTPDLYLSNSARPVGEYDNPSLLPGMFPSLFPLGVGGLDDRSRAVPISIRAHADYLLDCSDKAVRRHHSFIFIFLNIWLRRMCHLHTHLVVSRRNLDKVAEKMTGVTSDSLNKLSDHLQDESMPREFSAEERGAFELLSLVDTVAANVPGSHSSKKKMRNTILAYAGFFGVPTLYFTINPNAHHSPIFQVMCGDTAVSLDDRYPQLVSAAERAVRLAEDPVAGADFFQFCVTCVFRDLFGWDFNEGRAGKEGILGLLKAFFGTDEFTNRGQLHGHFLIWLEGAPNPAIVHDRLRSSVSYRGRFFAFFDSIIKNDLPAVECAELLNPDYDPRVERAIPPPDLDSSALDEVERESLMKEWARNFLVDLKGCGERLQRHVCKPVCHKYGNDGKCRFQFPHDLVESSYFDEESNSILLCVRDATVNYHNQYILVFCRHNHDLKCILSGKSAKAAMMYITDYITKMDLKTYQILSLLSKAVVNLNRPGESGDRVDIDLGSLVLNDTKKMLHSCLSQFARLSEVHAQQAVRLIRGFEGSWESHKSTVMLSRALISHVKRMYRLGEIVSAGGDECDEEEGERETFRMDVDDDGRLIRTNQVWDYFLRDERLNSVGFYEFVLRFKLAKKKAGKNPQAAVDARVRAVRYSLKREHQLASSHDIVESRSDVPQIPRVYGRTVPNPANVSEFQLFALSHFKPFSEQSPLVPEGSTVSREFETFDFSPFAKRIMNNWTALHESGDARDDERMKKSAAALKESRCLAELARKGCTIEDTLDSFEALTLSGSAPDFQCQQLVNVLLESGWFEKEELTGDSATSSSNSRVGDEDPYLASFGVVNDDQMRKWRLEIKHAEKRVKDHRRSEFQGGGLVEEGMSVRETLTDAAGASRTKSLGSDSDYVRPTIGSESAPETIGEAVERIRKKNGLNTEQSLAYDIIVQKYLELLDLRDRDKEHEFSALRLFLTGPGGTGKTHVVNCVKEVMSLYGKAHTIRFLAPTGAAANLIQGSTIHSGLGISIRNGSHNSDAWSSSSCYVQVSVKNKNEMRAEWKAVDVLLIDEVSMVSLTLLGDIDHALRYVKEKPNEWFGGIIVIFSGDLYQYPPVNAPALYSSISPLANMTDKELRKRIGALAWNSLTDVVELSEQHRMKADPEYAAAVLRLRKRECTLADALLFNSRLVKSASNPGGVDLRTPRALKGVAIVTSNNHRKALNILKARANCSGELSKELKFCEALDVLSDSKLPVPNDMPSCPRDALLSVDVNKKQNGSLCLPGIIPLYVGMPVVLREKNISTDLGITNGANGRVEHVTFKPFSMVNSRTVADVVFVHFPDCRIQLSLLPPSVIPLTHVSTGFKAKIQIGDSGRDTERITRHQLCIQPGFSVTGHSAQGQTLPFVIIDLTIGGFGAYVGASRPTSREGLAILKEVSVLDLRARLSDDLKVECRRLEALAHNTKVRYGALREEMVTVSPLKGLNVDNRADPKTAYASAVSDFNVTYLDTPAARSAANKRNAGDNGETSVGENQLQKRRRTLPKPSSSYLPGWMSRGCSWRTDYSCAYDVMTMGMCLCYFLTSDSGKSTLRNGNSIVSSLCGEFDRCILGNGDLGEVLNRARDFMRASAAVINPLLFPATGAFLVPVGDLYGTILAGPDFTCLSTLTPIVSCTAPSCPSSDFHAFDDQYSVATTMYGGSILSLPDERMMRVLLGRPVMVTQLWMDTLQPYPEEYYVATSNYHSILCRGILSYSYSFNFACPVLKVEVPSDFPAEVAPSLNLNIRMTNHEAPLVYRLASMIVLQQNHYFSYLLVNDDVALYDGQRNEGAPEWKGKMTTVFDVSEDVVLLSETCRPCVFMYVLV